MADVSFGGDELVGGCFMKMDFLLWRREEIDYSMGRRLRGQIRFLFNSYIFIINIYIIYKQI
ncbi:MAG: hypothetical protein WA130_12300 [Candidatus Methanoperedens sp.]